MKIDLPDNTIRSVEAMVSRQGGDVTAFIDNAVRRSLFFETARQVREQNADHDLEEAWGVIDSEVEAVRQERWEQGLDADRS